MTRKKSPTPARIEASQSRALASLLESLPKPPESDESDDESIEDDEFNPFVETSKLGRVITALLESWPKDVPFDDFISLLESTLSTVRQMHAKRMARQAKAHG